MLGCKGSPAGTLTRDIVHAVGNCHIDTAWLWPFDETRRKVCITFHPLTYTVNHTVRPQVTRSWATAVEYLRDEKYPSYTFAASQAQQFAWLKADSPELFSRIQAAVTAGRFIPVSRHAVTQWCAVVLQVLCMHAGWWRVGGNGREHSQWRVHRPSIVVWTSVLPGGSQPLCERNWHNDCNVAGGVWSPQPSVLVTRWVLRSHSILMTLCDWLCPLQTLSATLPNSRKSFGNFMSRLHGLTLLIEALCVLFMIQGCGHEVLYDAEAELVPHQQASPHILSVAWLGWQHGAIYCTH